MRYVVDAPRRATVYSRASTAFQFAYTTLFGMYAAFVWARTGTSPPRVAGLANNKS